MTHVLQEFAIKYPDMSEDEAVKYLTDRFIDLPPTIQDAFGALVLSRAIDTKVGKFELKSGLLTIFEAAQKIESGDLEKEAE